MSTAATETPVTVDVRTAGVPLANNQEHVAYVVPPPAPSRRKVRMHARLSTGGKHRYVRRALAVRNERPRTPQSSTCKSALVPSFLKPPPGTGSNGIVLCTTPPRDGTSISAASTPVPHLQASQSMGITAPSAGPAALPPVAPLIAVETWWAGSKSAALEYPYLNDDGELDASALEIKSGASIVSYGSCGYGIPLSWRECGTQLTSIHLDQVRDLKPHQLRQWKDMMHESTVYPTLQNLPWGKMRLADVQIMAIDGALPLPVIHNEVVACRRFPPELPPGYTAWPNEAPPGLPWATSPAPQGWERWPCVPEAAIHPRVFKTVLSDASPAIAFWLGNGHPFEKNPAKCTEMQALSRCMLDFKMTPEDPWGSVAAMQRVGALKWLNPRVDLRTFVHDATDTGPLGLYGRLGLQGQTGLYNAGTTIPAYTFLGWYSGNMCAADSPMLQRPGVEDRLFDVNWPISGGECLIVPDDDCLLQFANDPSLNLYNKRNNMTARSRQNAVFVVIAVCGVPMPMVMTDAPILPGEQVALNYGKYRPGRMDD